MRIAQVGVGEWGKNILRDLVALGCQVTAVARSEASILRARQHGAIAIVDNVVDIEHQDAIVVAVPTSNHAEVLDQVLSYDRPVFVEKPLTNNVESAARFRSCDQLFVMDKWRYHPGVLAMKGLIQQGTYGSLKGIHTTRHSLFNPHPDTDAVWILAPHDLSIILELTGSVPEPLAAVGYKNGIESSLHALLEGSMSIDVSSRANVHRREIRVAFEEAVVALSDGYSDVLEVKLTRQGSEPAQTSIPIGSELPLKAELESFLSYVRGGRKPRSSAAEGVMIVERIHQMREMAGI